MADAVIRDDPFDFLDRPAEDRPEPQPVQAAPAPEPADSELGEVGPPPDDLPLDAHRHWRRMAAELGGRLKEVDREMLKLYSTLAVDVEEVGAQVPRDKKTGKMMRFLPVFKYVNEERPVLKRDGTYQLDAQGERVMKVVRISKIVDVKPHPIFESFVKLRERMQLALRNLKATPQARGAYGKADDSSKESRNRSRTGSKFLERRKRTAPRMLTETIQ